MFLSWSVSLSSSSELILEVVSLFPLNTKHPTLIPINDKADADAEYSSSSSLVSYFSYSYEDMVEIGDPGFKWVHPKKVVNYTSGTTSSPKGVVQSHRAVGGTIIYLRKVEASTIYSLIDRHGVTHMSGAPVVLNILTKSPDVEPLKNPVHIITAGAPPPAAMILRTESLGFVVSHGYGLTETAGLVVSCAWKQKWNTLPARERARLKARQGYRRECETRWGFSRGKAVLRGGCLMLVYLKDTLGTSKCMKDGWFYTGDVGVLHHDGYLEIKDRSKDVIISGGENISSVEVESVLYTHPAIHEAAVVGRADEFWGKTPCAFVD
ncbi:hypothetical protein DKX38_019896 [Salix brachista]|uniref:AMP-dependent synthetase/ligase domain-containing protein n=1 Tax=Salix brachista TaxID=2182728 RepID=A0A5N5KHJ2_9ROSI|nr:hypothetical protein DKX38_019896 [Salix brachista]